MYRIPKRIVIGGGSTLEQAAPSPLQVALPFQRILEGTGHGLFVSTARKLQPFANGNGSTVFTRLKGQKTPRGARGRSTRTNVSAGLKVKRSARQRPGPGAIATNIQKGSGKGWHQELRLLD